MPDTESESSKLFIGAMSGTSLDGIDLVLVDLHHDPRSLAHEHITYSAEFREQLRLLCESDSVRLEDLMAMDAELGRLIAQGVSTLLKNTNLTPADIAGIGSHGQTVRHCPPHDTIGTTLQIADPNTIATQTGITVVADFRRANLANGGHGAPLAPAFHARAFGKEGVTRAVVNVGGMANVTLLQSNEPVLGFDCGPGNVLMDGWINKTKQLNFDEDGLWAASGEVDTTLLSEFQSHPFFALPAPKSTGREEFNNAWLEQHLQKQSGIAAENVQATLLELTASTIASSISTATKNPVEEVYVCGGGAYNPELMKRLAALLPNSKVDSSAALGIAPDLVECCAFAWFAQQTLLQQSVPTKRFTGGHAEAVMGGIFYG